MQLRAGCLACWVAAVLSSTAAEAVEGGAGFYLLGSKGSMAGFVPPPGSYVSIDNYFYAGEASDGREFPIGGAVVADVEADVFYKIGTALWIAPDTIAGANLGLGVSGVVGWKDVSASVVIDPVGGINAEDERFGLGDPVLSALLGWHRGNWHWSVGTLINVPLGQWDRGRLANSGFNRWGVDLNGALTWLDMASGFELSGAAGVTFNFENPETDYESGTEFHLEFAAVKALSKQFSLGVGGYHYQQLTGDSGPGARLGDFKGRVTAVGPIVKYSFAIGETPVSTSFRWFHEFNEENRLGGNAAILSLSIPLSPSISRP